jgi:hypothetical protein
MKYLKKFESFDMPDYVEYWSVKSEEYYMRKALKKINCPDETIESFVDYVNIHPYLDKKLYVVREIKNGMFIYWDASYEYGTYISGDYNGEIELTKKELEEVEMKKQADKYNL